MTPRRAAGRNPHVLIPHFAAYRGVRGWHGDFAIRQDALPSHLLDSIDGPALDCCNPAGPPFPIRPCRNLRAKSADLKVALFQ
jgi:hypothetical protein